MKRDLLLAAFLVVVALLGVGLVVVLPILQRDDETGKLIKPKTEPIAELKKPEEPVKPAWNEKKQRQIKKPIDRKKEEKKISTPEPEPTKRPEPKQEIEKKKIPEPEKKIEPKVEVEPKKEDKRPKVIEFDPLTFLNDPGGEYTVKSLHTGKEIQIEGKIKTLKINSVNERAVIDASKLDAEEIIFLGGINGGAKVILGKKLRKLVVREVNDKSTLDASACEVAEIVLNGAVNSRSTVKLNAPKGSVEIFGEINDHAQIEINAPGGKVLFKSRGDAIINGDARLDIVAKDVDLSGTINGADTQLTVTLTKDGSLKFRRLNGEALLNWRKADDRDPMPRIDAGTVDGRAYFGMVPALKK